MTLVEKYIFKMAAIAFLAALFALTSVIWLTQALREFDLLTTKGQSLLIFFSITGLTIPSLITVIAPMALFVAIIYTLNKLNGDSELIVMAASGLSPSRLVRPFALLSIIVTLFVGSMSLYLMPASFKAIRDLVTKVRSDFLTRIVKEGQFTTLDQGFVFHYRERGPGGALMGVFMQDRREAGKVSTYVAEVGLTAEIEGHSYLVLDRGTVQRSARGDQVPAMIAFERYAIDLAQFGTDGSGIPLRPRERSTLQILQRKSVSDDYMRANEGRFRAEVHDRFGGPLYSLTFAMIAFAALSQARTTRQGRGMAIAAAVVGVILVRVLGFWATAMATRTAGGVFAIYTVPVLGFLVAGLYAFAPDMFRRFGLAFLRLKPKLPALARG